MRKLAALVAYIIEQLDFVAAENVQSFHVIEQYKPSGDYVRCKSTEGVCLYDQVYLAVINIERLPAEACPPELIFGLLSCWIMENDPHRHRNSIDRDANGALIPLELPSINTVLESESTVSVELIVPFREPVFGVLDAQGLFVVNGNKYRLADSADPAEQFEYDYISNF